MSKLKGRQQTPEHIAKKARKCQELVTAEEHQLAWKAAHVNNGYRKPEMVMP